MSDLVTDNIDPSGLHVQYPFRNNGYQFDEFSAYSDV